MPSRSARHLLAALLLGGAAAFLAAASAGPARDDGATFPDLGLTLRLPALEGAHEVPVEEDGPYRGSWAGQLGESEVGIDLIVLSREEFGFHEPGGVSEEIVGFLRKAEAFDVDDSSYVEGPFGAAPYAAIVEGPITDAGQEVGHQLVLGGLLPEHGYALHVTATPAPGEADLDTLRGFLAKGVAYDGPLREAEWTNEEAEARWLRDAPDDLHEDFTRNLKKKAWVKKSLLRTDHYLILTNSDGGKKFGQQMEKNHDAIQKLFPFEEVEGMRLMPVFLFKLDEDYFRYTAKITGMSVEEARRTGGHAWRDYYACWYEAPGDPVHIHEQTHQIFHNRLFLNGGGSWFQEGVAEYVETSENERNVVANLIGKGQGIPLVDFVQMESLVFSSESDRKTGGSAAGDAYKQAALLIEFLREGPRKSGFERFLQVIGHTPSGDLQAIRDGFQRVYGATLEELDQEFQRYCDKR